MNPKILIVDDESPIRTSLAKLIHHYLGNHFTIQEASGVEEGLQKINANPPEILFLDIEMEDGTGFDLLKKIDNPNFQLIFTTAHNQYAIQAFEFSAINYLLKPISPLALEATLQKALKNIQQNNLQAQLDILMSKISNQVDHNQKIALKDINSTYFVKIQDVIFCQADGPYTKFAIKGMPDILISKHLKAYEEMFAPFKFIRCHHSYLVNSSLISRFDKNEGGCLIMDGGERIPVSQRKRDAVLAFLETKV
ncbi:MAG: LytR/AlgR family response regulator transcription factor [Saprospiraceae bacterium]